MKVLKISSLFCLFLLVSSSLFAQFKIYEGKEATEFFEGAKLIRVDEARKVPVYAEFYLDSRPSNDGFFKFLKSQLKLDDRITFQLLKSKADRFGVVHNKYRQYFNGIEYAYINLTLHSKDGKVSSFSGNFSSLIPQRNSVSISHSAAYQNCLNTVSAEEYYETENEHAKNETEYVYLRTTDKNGNYKISKCYQLNIYAKTPLSRTLFFVNAETGEIEFEESLIHTGSSEGKAVTAYSDTQNIITDSLSSSFRLVDTTRGNGVETYNCQKTKNYNSAIDFTDADNFWNNVNTNLDQYATDAHWGAQMMYDYLDSEHNYKSINDADFPLKTYMHYDVSYVNAFWDGQRVSIGDGNQNTTPLSPLDIMGHEFAHGLTRFSANLIYAKESGALNESFSDIFGTSLEFYARPSRANWTVGEDLGGSFRSMSNPKQYGDPDTYGGQNWRSQNCIPNSGNDQCGVHSNSGVQNRWFYLVTRGDTGVNDLADSFIVSGIGLQKAASIAFRNLTLYLSASSNYQDARFFSIIAAADLYGACSPEVETVTNAWYAVGVGNEYENNVNANFTAIYDTSYCSAPATISFKSTGSNVINFRWDFGNGDTSNLRNPTTLYLNQGAYDVRLIADGGTCGSDTIFKSNYIELDTNIACAFVLNNVSKQTVSDCNGRLMDTGGIDEDYNINENGVFTIDVPGSDYIELSFIDLSVLAGDGFSCNKDYLEVYDGDSTDSPSLGRFCQNNLPTGNQLISSTNQVTLRFYSDELVTSSGFLINWECKMATQLPSVDFGFNTDSSCSGKINFYNLTSNGANNLLWDFGDGLTSAEANPEHEYKSNGTFTVKLIAENSIGIDSVVKNTLITIDRPLAPVIASDTFCLGADGGFKVNTNQTIEWYRDTTAASVLTGDTVTFFNMKADTSLFYREISKNQKFNGGPMNSIGSGGYSNDNDFVEFDVHEDVFIHSILFFSNRTGIRTLDVRNNKGDIVISKEVYMPSSALLVTVNLPLIADTNYRISISSRNNGLYKNTTGANFPYAISNLITLKNTSASAGEYPFFYRWSVSKLSCVSNFEMVTAYVDTSCVITGIDDLKVINEFRIYPNPVSQELVIENNGLVDTKNIELKLYSSTGQLIYSATNKTDFRITKIDVKSYPSGVYYLKIAKDGKISTNKIVKLD